LIAECKKASPSRGLIAPDYSASKLAKEYIEAGAAAISVLTNSRYFQGSLEDLRDVRELIDSGAVRRKHSRDKGIQVAILRKDFIFHPYQVYESRVAGADAVLLIAAVLEQGEIRELGALANNLGISALIEVHNERELEMVLETDPRIIGVNNRNLQTFEVDFDTTARLREKIPADIAVVAESGVKTAADVRLMKELNVDAVLVGTALVSSKNTGAQVRSLVASG
jgi:indole-3-glycerol phosphate synthase